MGEASPGGPLPLPPGGVAMAQGPVVSEDGTIDVAEVMAAIRARLREGRGRGPASDAEVEELTEATLQVFSEEMEIDSDLLARLGVGQDWNIAPDYPIETHRKGPSAWLLLGVKALVRPFIRLYTDQPLSRQAQINRYLLHLCRHLVRELVRLRLENAAAPGRRPDALDPQGKTSGG